MDRTDELLKEMRRMNQSLLMLIAKLTPNKMQKIPQAAHTLGISPARLRKLCAAGTIPAVQTSCNRKMKHYIVDVEQAKDILLKYGIDPQKSTAPRKGRKSTLTLTK